MQAQWRTPEFQAAATAGFDRLFRLDYEGAARSFEALQRRYPEHPGPAIYRATTVWLQELSRRQDLDLHRLVSPAHFTKKTAAVMDPSDRLLFDEQLERAERLCKDALREVPGDLEAKYFLGSVHGVRAGFEITINRSSRGAVREGKKIYKLHREIVEADPEFYDAYLSLGMYEYIIGSLPWYMKLPARLFGYKGSKKRGLEYLNLAATRSLFVRDNARGMQMVIFVREKRLSEALSIANELHAKYPESYLLHLNRAQIAERLGQTDEAVRLYESFMARAEAGEPNYALAPLEKARLVVGRRLLLLGRPEAAERILARSVEQPATPGAAGAWPTLELGRSLDLQGKREAAVERYRHVLEMPEDGDSHKIARRCLKRACVDY